MITKLFDKLLSLSSGEKCINKHLYGKYGWILLEYVNTFENGFIMGVL